MSYDVTIRREGQNTVVIDVPSLKEALIIVAKTMSAEVRLHDEVSVVERGKYIFDAKLYEEGWIIASFMGMQPVSELGAALCKRAE